MNQECKVLKNPFVPTIVLMLVTLMTVSGQVGINVDGSNPDGSAILDLKSSSKGFLPPRMTSSERDLIVNPSEGLVIYVTDRKSLYFFNGSIWKSLISEFVCGDQIVDSEGNVYNTVQIGSQCWMADNLNIGTMINSTSNQTNNSTIEKYCYDNDPANCTTYGGLYQWDEMMQYTTIEGAQGVCPTGWHLPSDAEWITLQETLGMCSGTDPGCSGDTGFRGTDQGSQLAGNETLWEDGALDMNAAFGSSGFNALPAGNRDFSGETLSQSRFAYFWSSSQSVSGEWNYIFAYDNQGIFRDDLNQSSGFSVRCVRD